MQEIEIAAAFDVLLVTSTCTLYVRAGPIASAIKERKTELRALRKMGRNKLKEVTRISFLQTSCGFVRQI